MSIVIAYYNKRQILFNTLKSIEHFRANYPIETIIVDDGSNAENKIDDFVKLFPTLNIKLIVLKKDHQYWRSPAVAYNTGFQQVKGDVIFINGADNVHLGNIIGCVFDNFKLNSYFNFSAIRCTEVMKKKIDYLEWKNINNFVNSLKISTADDWHIHSEYLPSLIPFCAAINKVDLEQLSGYDERFSNGIGFEDSDLDARISNLGLDICLIDNPFCMHQKHPPIEYINSINHDLFYRLQIGDANRTKAKHNKIYVK